MKKLSKNQQKYRELSDKLNEELYNLSDKKLNKMLFNEKEVRDDFLNEIGRILLSYKITDNFLELSSIEKTKLNKELNSTINSIFKVQIDEEYKFIKDILITTGADKYYSNSYILNLGLDFNLKKVTDKELNNILNKTIDGKNYSDRLWDNKNQVSKKLKVEVNKFLNGETNLNEIEKIIKTKFNQNAYNTKRLVETETSRTMEEVNSKWQEDHNIEYVMYSATLDSTTCAECGENDGQIYKVDEKPVELPLHPNCRCTYIALPKEDWKPNTRLNNETKEKIDYKTYKDWKEEQDL